MHSILELFPNFLGGTLIVSLNGDAKEAHSVMEGRYFLHADNIENRDNRWIQENGSNSIWYRGSRNYNFHYDVMVFNVWIIGNQFATIYSTDEFNFNPLLVSNWRYKASNGKWTTSDNVLVGPGNVVLSLGYNLYHNT